MSIKEDVLRILENNKGEYISGQQLAEQMDVSRNAIWKAVSKLKEEGYGIESITNKGYCLMQSADILSGEMISAYCSPAALYYYDEIDSTNEEAKRLATKGAPHGTLVVANKQTMGKGRRGRSFYSPADTGIYMSMLIRPDLEFSESVFVTTATSVAVARAIENVYGLDAQIKWVNDVYLNGHKICGILSEAVTDFESGTIDNIIVGIGVNVKTEDFPDDIADRAGSLIDSSLSDGSRSRLAAEIYNQFMQLSDALPDKSFMSEYKSRSMVIGKRIRYTKKSEWLNGIAADIDEQGGLVVDSETEGRIVLSSGEITIRLND